MLLTMPPGVRPGDPLAVSWEGAEYEVLAPEGVAAGERVSGYAVLAGQSRHHGASMSRWVIGDWAGNAVRSVVPASGSMT